jgi:hypothetical protein
MDRTKDFGFAYNLKPNDRIGAAEANLDRLQMDAGMFKFFGTDVRGTAGLTYAWLGGVIGREWFEGGHCAVNPDSTTYFELDETLDRGAVAYNEFGFSLDKTPLAIVRSDTERITEIRDRRPAGKPGVDGIDGIGYTIALTQAAHVFPASETAALPASISFKAVAFNGQQNVACTVGAITGQVTGLTASASNETNTPTITVTATAQLTQKGGALVMPIIVDGIEFPRVFAWALALKGATGAGKDGAAATVAVGDVTTLAAGSSATVANVGTAAAAKLNFGIPKGEKGDKGDGADITFATKAETEARAATAKAVEPAGLLNFALKSEMPAAVAAVPAGAATTLTGSAYAVTLLTGQTTAAGTANTPAGTFGKFVSAASAATARTVMIRDANGRAQVAAPAADADIPTKKYVDDALSEIALSPGTSFWAWSTGASLTNISFVAGSKVGDYFVNTSSTSRTILGNTAAIGDVIKSTRATTGEAAGNIRGTAGAAGKAGMSFWAWSTAVNPTEITYITGANIGDYIVNTGAAARTILGVPTDIGGVVKITSPTAGTAAGNIRGPKGDGADIAFATEAQAQAMSHTGAALSPANLAHASASDATAARLVRRDAEGRAQVAEPAVDADIATKGYVDTALAYATPEQARAMALDDVIISPASLAEAAPTIFEPVDPGLPHPGAGLLIRRDAEGRAQVSDPGLPADIATKYYVDSQGPGVEIRMTRAIHVFHWRPAPNNTAYIEVTAWRGKQQLPVTLGNVYASSPYYPDNPSLVQSACNATIFQNNTLNASILVQFDSTVQGGGHGQVSLVATAGDKSLSLSWHWAALNNKAVVDASMSLKNGMLQSLTLVMADGTTNTLSATVTPNF